MRWRPKITEQRGNPRFTRTRQCVTLSNADMRPANRSAKKINQSRETNKRKIQTFFTMPHSPNFGKTDLLPKILVIRHTTLCPCRRIAWCHRPKRLAWFLIENPGHDCKVKSEERLKTIMRTNVIWMIPENNLSYSANRKDRSAPISRCVIKRTAEGRTDMEEPGLHYAYQVYADSLLGFRFTLSNHYT